MAVAIATQTTSNWALLTDGGTNHIDLTMTKPTSLAVGDLLIAVISRDIGDPGTLTEPSGWTQTREDNNTGAHYLSIHYKVADSSDVSASDFTWSWVTASDNMAAAGAIFRITGANTGNIIWTSNSDGSIDNTAAPSFNNTITPGVANSMLILVASAYQNNNAIGGYAIVTSNPSWTEVVDMTDNTGTDHSLSIATAIRPEITATGNSSVTGGDATSDWVGTIFSIPPSKAVSQTDTLTTSEPSNSYIRIRTFSQTDTLTTSEIINSDESRAWTNESKSSTMWTNQDKS